MCSPTTSWRSTPAGISRCSRSKLASWAKRGLTSASPALTSSSSASYSPRGRAADAAVELVRITLYFSEEAHCRPFGLLQHAARFGIADEAVRILLEEKP